MKFLQVKSPLLLLLFALLTFLTLDALLFRSGLYRRYVSIPYNNTAILLNYAEEHSKTDKPKILILGNSAMHSDFAWTEFRDDNPNAPFEVIPLFERGINLPVQYHFLKELDPKHNRYKAIIIPLESYQMLSSSDPTDNSDYRDALEIGSFLRTSEWPEFVKEYQGTKIYSQVLMSFLAYDRLYSDDLSTLVPTQRIANNLLSKKEIYEEIYNNSGYPDSLSGLKLTKENAIAYCPFEVERCAHLEYKKQTLSEAQKQRNAQKFLEFEKKWLTKMIALYQNSPTKILFIKIPHTVFAGDRSPLPNAPQIKDILPKQKNVDFLDENYFQDLSDFKYMSDSMHVTHTAATLFTKRLTPILYRLADTTPPKAA